MYLISLKKMFLMRNIRICLHELWNIWYQERRNKIRFLSRHLQSIWRKTLRQGSCGMRLCHQWKIRNTRTIRRHVRMILLNQCKSIKKDKKENYNSQAKTMEISNEKNNYPKTKPKTKHFQCMMIILKGTILSNHTLII